MRFAKTFFAALAVTFAAAGVVKSVSPAQASESAVCNDSTKECVRVRWSDGTTTL